MGNKIIFIFLDGIGLGLCFEYNPFTKASMTTLGNFFNTPLIKNKQIAGNGFLLKGLDACLGVRGIPQSATGQTALLTGINAAQKIGFHLPAYPNDSLVSIIKKHNIYKKALALNKKPIFANAYSDLYFQLVKLKKRRHSVTTHCVMAANLPFLTLEDLCANRAVFWDITRHTLKRKYNIANIPPVTAFTAGKHLAFMAKKYDLVVFESFLPDLAGHSQNQEKAIKILETIDKFIDGVLAKKDKNVTVVISSDHGNIEDLSTNQHTTNPVPLIVIGEEAEVFFSARSILHVSRCILKALAN